MSDWAYNPVHGWSQGPYDGLGAFGSIADGFFPAPAGMQWVDIGGSSMGGGCSGGCGFSSCGGGCSGGPGGLGGFLTPPMMSGALGYGGLGGLGGIYCGGLGLGLGGLGGLYGPGPTGQSYQQIGIPVEDKGTPGINIKNPSGGIGLEPGYNYIFPDEHCKVHVLKTKCPPWQLEGVEQVEFQAHMVPTCVTMKVLLEQFGCDNSNKGKNICYEVTQGGGGKWYKGLTIMGDNDKLMDKRVSDMGWGRKRDGVEAEVVWLYFTKD